MKKRILLMCGWFNIGGIESYVLNILDYIDREKYVIDVALPRQYTYGAEKVISDRRTTIHYYDDGKSAIAAKEIREILRNGNYDIVHIMQNYPVWDGPMRFFLICVRWRRQLGYKIINHAHSTEDRTRRVSKPKVFIRDLYRGMMRYLSSSADAFAACSPEAGKFLYGRKDVKVLYNGIDLARFSGANVQAKKHRKKYGISENSINFVIVAGMTEVKNPYFVLKVVSSLKRYYPNVLLTWVGDGPLRVKIEEQIRTCDLEKHVNLLGIQHQVQEILACCDYFLLPSRTEGAPLAIVEAQAAGLQCFASDRVPNIIDCGSVSFISLDKSADQWADEIHTLIETNTKTGVNPALLQRFDIRETVQDLCKLYDSLLN